MSKFSKTSAALTLSIPDNYPIPLFSKM
jgi:hypothetical protein